MKNLLLVLVITLIFSNYSFAQDFKVIHINGTIVAQSTQKSLERGSSFSETEKFNYKTKDATAMVINTKAGTRYVLKNSSGTENYQKANLTPSMSNISSRSAGLNNRFDLKSHFDGKLVILETLRIKINKSIFPMNENQFFFIRYLYKGEIINKKLSFKNDTLMINKDSLLSVDGKPILNEEITEMELMYYSTVNDKLISTLISSTFYPVFPVDSVLKEEIKIMKDVLKDRPEPEIINTVNNYIIDVYGKTDYENIEEWYRKTFTEN
jgi:hypothetical protein